MVVITSEEISDADVPSLRISVLGSVNYTTNFPFPILNTLIL